MEMDGIYHKLDYIKYEPYIITEIFTNGTVRVQWVHVNEITNIGRLKTHFDE